MRRCAALAAVVLAVPLAPRAQEACGTPSPEPAAPPPAAAAAPSAADLARIRRSLAAPTVVRDAAGSAPEPTFRVSVSEKIDIWKYWGEPDAVAAMVRPSGGTWHQEFQNMVTPDEFKGYGGILTNSEKLQLATTSLLSAGILKLIGVGVAKAAAAHQASAQQKAKEEVRGELAAFCASHRDACAATPATPP